MAQTDTASEPARARHLRVVPPVPSRRPCTECPRFKTCRAPCAELEAELPQEDEVSYRERPTLPARAEWLGTVRREEPESVEERIESDAHKAEWAALLALERGRLEEALRYEVTAEQAELVRLLLAGRKNHEIAALWKVARPTVAIMRRRAVERLSASLLQRSFGFG